MFYDPVRLRTLARFSAPDPWAGNQLADYSIDDFVMLPLGSRRTIDSKWSMHTVGIQWDGNAQFRLLPESLVELWRQGSAKLEDLPLLLHAIEPRLLETDCMTSQTWQRSVGLPLLAVLFFSPLVFMLIRVDGQRMPGAAAIASGLATTLFAGGVLWLQRSAKRRRVKEQMEWAMNVLAAGLSSQSRAAMESPVKAFFKVWLKLVGISIAIAAIAGFSLLIYLKLGK